MLSLSPTNPPCSSQACFLVQLLYLLPKEGLEGLEAGLSQLIIIQVAELLHQGHQASQVGPYRAKGSLKSPHLPSVTSPQPQPNFSLAGQIQL